MHAATSIRSCLLALAGACGRLSAADEPGRPPAGPAQAVLAAAHALRGDDAAALWAMHGPVSVRAAILDTLDAPGPGGFIRERIDEALASVQAADAQEVLVARWLSWSAGGLVAALARSGAPPPPADLPPHDLLPTGVPPTDPPPPGPPGPGGPPGAGDWTALAGHALASALAQGLETRQIAAAQRLLAAGRSWAAGIAVADPAAARAAVAALLAAVTDLGASSVADLARLDQGELLARAGRALGHLKAAARAYGFDLDAVLDSLRIVDVMALQPGGGSAAVTIAFSAFSAEQRFPLKMRRAADGSWSVIADSPLGALLGDRQGAMDALLGPPSGFPPAGPGGPDGRAERGAPPPRGKDGF
jgi:hypothetical protein